MLPGPTLIRECPHCKGRFKEDTLTSGNTFGARFWTDGKMEANMLPETDWLVTCPNCLAPVWIDSARKVGQVDFYRETSDNYKGADLLEYGQTPSAEGYLIALRDTPMPIDKQAYIRFRLWRLWNDRRRHCTIEKAKSIPLKVYETANLEELIKLLDETDLDKCVAKAEINRELGRFDEAINLLDWSNKDDDSGEIKYIRQLAQDNDPYLREFKHTSN